MGIINADQLQALVIAVNDAAHSWYPKVGQRWPTYRGLTRVAAIGLSVNRPPDFPTVRGPFYGRRFLFIANDSYRPKADSDEQVMNRPIQALEASRKQSFMHLSPFFRTDESVFQIEMHHIPDTGKAFVVP